MNAVENQVRELVSVELAAANEKFPQFHSPHEGWAVMQEEIKKLIKECKRTKIGNKEVFGRIMENEKACAFARYINIHAIRAACEAIQVAAMAQKYLDMENENA